MYVMQGPFWRVKQRKDKGHRHDSKALWIIEAESAEWGGSVVSAQLGVEAVDNSKRKGYRLEHVCSGKYLAVSQTQVRIPIEVFASKSKGYQLERGSWFVVCESVRVISWSLVCISVTAIIRVLKWFCLSRALFAVLHGLCFFKKII